MSETPVHRDPRHWMRPGTLQLGALPPLSLYIHLPWCLKKCPYCDFNSHEWSATSAPGDPMPEARYLDALRADLEASLPLVWGRPVHSVFIGGGTPSLFSPEAIDRLLADVRARLPLEPGAEITLEANPGTFEKDRFRAFRQAGVTRLSIGVQSFDDAQLKALGRVHDGAQARAALEEAAQVFDTFNLDLMYALPGQTLAQCEADLRTALSFAPPHLSVYHLTLEPNTWFAKYPPRLPSDDEAYEMLDLITALTAEAGLQRYEVSAYARPGHVCRHNLNYWRFGDYLGIGAGAHGKLSFAHRIARPVRVREPRLYMERALAGDAVASMDEVPRAQLPFEFMLNALRLREGFALADFMAGTGLPLSSIDAALREAEAKGLIEREGAQVRPTERGFDFLSDLQALFLPG
ncbi:MAG: oxygen-independent coproporphyrinogen III oxidase-like protein [Hydrogenophaga sp.]|nr:oxygen-independent coproporphyrinogen III oxidase-like protein [Hydrogenophaga sp.]NIN25730.1 oxygen-independent coproporphyrinogen III oxidase-like protein [Hydrogenophaga sp.]NIN30392.1 oxygen-independent coproporphyrinogen III oxidase-like protein [Hydrogenophaga sp.]NIN56732.1 oxygen-independent coproporphyrinogen III oxidase-like protein [Hydrogenophaga sp.]NIO53307.1 oxygen-independent coproporphyrinogen III oxidase-like protein [Hydrogenophaga sp.]